MGSGNKERRESQTQYNQALTTAQAESPYERRRREINESITNWGKSGDYRTPPSEAKVFFNFADPAERRRQQDALANTRGQGVSALGAGANPTLLALDKQHRDAVSEEDAARNYQQTAAAVVGGASGELADLDAADRARRMGVLSTTAGTYNTQVANRQPSWWQKMLLSGYYNAERGAGTAGAAG